jgi:hypothetical protein
MKPSIILLHNTTDSPLDTDRVADRFRMEYAVFSCRFREWDEQGNYIPFSIREFVNQLETFIHRHKLSEFSVFGYGLGGYVALKYALTHPSAIDNVYTFGSKYHWTTHTNTDKVVSLNADILEEKAPVFSKLLKRLAGGTDWRSMLKNTEDLMKCLGAGAGLIEEDKSTIACLMTHNVADPVGLPKREIKTYVPGLTKSTATEETASIKREEPVIRFERLLNDQKPQATKVSKPISEKAEKPIKADNSTKKEFPFKEEATYQIIPKEKPTVIDNKAVLSKSIETHSDPYIELAHKLNFERIQILTKQYHPGIDQSKVLSEEEINHLMRKNPSFFEW